MAQSIETNNLNYHRFSITAEKVVAEILLALLSAEPFEGFEETDYGFLAYISEQHEKQTVIERLVELKNQFNFEYSYEYIKKINWNSVWEKSFQPIVINDFCAVRAPFHSDLPNVSHEIIIEPKMAFGTGHHATTYMVMESMEHLNFKNKQVLDFGCGTGILAILASMLGAKHINAIDNDPICSANTKENAALNNIKNISSLLGAKDSIPVKLYDIILANINRNVILNALPKLFELLKEDGHLLISGFVVSDRDLLHQETQKANFKIYQERVKNKWICMHLNK